VGFFGLALAVPVYTYCVLRGALRFFIKVFLLIKKKKKSLNSVFFFLFNGGSGIGYFILPIDEEACFPLLLGSGYCVMLVRERPCGD
jgi:hypothetical protein